MQLLHMNKRNLKLITASGGLVALVAAMFWLALQRGPLAPVAVEVAAAREAALDFSVFGIGTIEARYSHAIGPTQAGRVLKVWVDQGDVVKAGQLLAEIDPVDLQARLNSAESSLQRARESVLVAAAQEREAQSRHKLAAANVARFRELARKNFVSHEAVEIRENEANMAQAAVEAARAAQRAAERDVERAQQEKNAVARQLANLKLVSPVNGIVVSRDTEPGTTVVAGQTVVRVIDPRHLWVRARIDQARALGVAPGQPAEIVLRSDQGTRHTGRVARVEIQSDSVTEERVVNVAFAGAPPGLALGELAEVTIRLGHVARAVAVPAAAVRRAGEQQGVWQLVDGAARFRPLDVGRQTLDGRTEVRKGLAAGEHVIVYSSAQLSEGMRVRPGKPL